MSHTPQSNCDANRGGDGRYFDDQCTLKQTFLDLIHVPPICVPVQTTGRSATNKQGTYRYMPTMVY